MTNREDLYQQAYNLFDRDRRRGLSWTHGIRAVVDLVLDARPDLSDAGVLREAARITRDRDWGYLGRTLSEEADRLEAEHLAAQEAAAAEVAREKLIEQAAHLLHDAQEPPLTPIPWEQTTEARRRDLTAHARALVDAGWRPAPTTDGGEA